MHLSKSLEALFSFKPLLWLARHHRITPRAEYLRLSDVSLKRFLCFERIVIVSSGQILIAFPGQSWHQAPSAQGNLITSLPPAHSEEQSLHSTVICLRPTCSHTSPYNDRQVNAEILQYPEQIFQRQMENVVDNYNTSQFSSAHL